MILACKDVSKAFGIDTILEKVTFNLEEKEKAAVVGVNGAGKTTLFKIITGETSKDGGEIYIKKNAEIGYLKQNAVIEGEKTIYEETVSVFEKIIEDERTLREMETEMAGLSGAELEKHMQEYSALQHSFEERDGYSYKSRTRGVLKGLGFTQEEFDKPVCRLSGGQKTRVYLGKLLLAKPDVLFLDEPTNHLDIESISWLEDYLRGYQGAVLIISHDRYFMDRIVTKTIEIENKKSVVYEGNYTFYAKQKAVNREIQIKQYEDQQKEIKRQEEVIKTLRAFNREKSIKRAESREKMLDKIERIEKPENLPEKMRLTLTPRITSGNDVLYAENLSKSYPGKKLFEGVNLDIKRKDKVAIIGPNGVGKSTLFKMLLGREKSDGGNMRFGTNVNIGYYDQEQQDFDERKTVFQEISDTYPTLTGGEIRNMLASFVFEGDDVFKPISALSGGEKGRLMLAKIMLGKANLLMLDEPTNHLDMFSKEILEDAINRYEGTVIYISHDRYFINRTAEKVLELTPSGIIQYLGNYDYYIEKKTAKEKEEQLFGSAQPKNEEHGAPSSLKLDWQSQKEQQAKERKHKNRILKIEKEIEEAENAVSELEKRLLEPSVATDAYAAQQIYEEKTALEEKLEMLMIEWEEAQE
ncbi:ABC-F family ATP-binding cassette domain-containing protein [Anaerotignum faecicola]|nr:ABC-F family ATP-binding cassette domain-containing protein [Anaerotignum faecicola]